MTRTQDYKIENKKLQDSKMTCATIENTNKRQMMKKLTFEIKQDSSNVVHIQCLEVASKAITFVPYPLFYILQVYMKYI
jgi:hypothetical protein